MEISAREAADRLGLNVVTVRRRAARGQLDARKVGNSWLISDTDVAARMEQPIGRGRRLSPRSAWAVLDVLSGVSPEGLSRSEQARARARAARAAELSPGDLEARAVTFRLRGPKGARERVPREPRGSFEVVFLRVTRPVWLSSRRIWSRATSGQRSSGPSCRPTRCAPASRERADVILRVPRPQWPFDEAVVVPPAVAAADVLDAGDSRSIAAARRVLAALATPLVR